MSGGEARARVASRRVSPLRPQEIRRQLQRLAPVAEAVLHLQRQFRERLIITFRDKHRVVTKPAPPRGRDNHPAFHPSEKTTKQLARPRDGDATHKPARRRLTTPRFRRHPREFRRQVTPVLLVVRPGAGVARGEHPRRAAERVHLQAGIVGDDPIFGEMGGRRQHLERGVVGEIGPRLLDLRQLRVGGEIHHHPLRAEDGAHLAGLVGVARGKQKVPRRGGCRDRGRSFHEFVPGAKPGGSKKQKGFFRDSLFSRRRAPGPPPAPMPYYFADMNERRKPYPFDRIEPKWQARWTAEQTFRTPNPGDADFDPAKPKFYVLDMFPYPSGTGLHVGHPEGYTATDIIARFRRMRGFNVLHPMGWDAFGLPAEQYAIKTGQHPRVTTETNVAKFKEQLTRLGFNYDWDREVNTTDPGYFKWTQWIFSLLYNSWCNPATGRAEPISTYAGTDPDNVRLAFVAEAAVNWCPGLGTVLANEEVVDGKSEVGGFPVERRPMRQWMLRITAYAERLINELDGLDWPESIKLLQRNWIGRSEGAHVHFVLEAFEDRPTSLVALALDTDKAEHPALDAVPEGHRVRRTAELTVFTTRPDTLFGATYMVLSPEHPLVNLFAADERKDAIAKYRAEIGGKSDLERTELSKEKTGVFIGAYAVNPVNGERIPVWIADYVLMGYGTGAIMAVPAHDERDWEFAKQFDLPIRPVVRVAGAGMDTVAVAAGEVCAPGEGMAIHSGFLDGLTTAEAKTRIIDWLEERGGGERRINYKLRDWLFARQRYWGEPFPILWRGDRHEILPESELPLLPPDLEDFKPTGAGEPPLARAADWVRYSDTARRETNTMPQWAGSCWYYLRFCDPRNTARFVGEEAERYWMGSAGGGQAGGVDLYVGGTEHAVLHLLYARFWHKVLHDRGYVSTPEPFQRLVNQGLILGEDGQKMSKSRGNAINPDDVTNEHGADALRLFEMFMGPLEQTKPWSMAGVQGVARFLARVWRLVMEENQEGEWQLSDAVRAAADPGAGLLKAVHATIKKVTVDIDALSFNTAIAQMMVCVNELTAAPARPVALVRLLLQVLNPFAPHLTEELWETLGRKFPLAADGKGGGGLLAHQPWPEHDERYLVEDEIEMPVQINGKLRDKLTVKKDATSEEIQALALASAKVLEHMGGKPVRKMIVVPGKLLNIVV